MHTRTTKGFSLMELLVVIAIIGILASVVIAGLAGARERARNNSAQASLQSLQLEAEIYFERNGRSYTNTGAFCGDAEISTLRNKACEEVNQSAGCGTCSANATSYGVIVPLLGGDFYCVDSVRRSGVTGTGTLNANGCQGL